MHVHVPVPRAWRKAIAKRIFSAAVNDLHCSRSGWSYSGGGGGGVGVGVGVGGGGGRVDQQWQCCSKNFTSLGQVHRHVSQTHAPCLDHAAGKAADVVSQFAHGAGKDLNDLHIASTLDSIISCSNVPDPAAHTGTAAGTGIGTGTQPAVCGACGMHGCPASSTSSHLPHDDTASHETGVRTAAGAKQGGGAPLLQPTPVGVGVVHHLTPECAASMASLGLGGQHVGAGQGGYTVLLAYAYVEIADPRGIAQWQTALCTYATLHTTTTAAIYTRAPACASTFLGHCSVQCGRLCRCRPQFCAVRSPVQ